MAQFLVLAYDGTDSDAKTRRAGARVAHLDYIKPMVAKGEIIVGGAILDDKGAPIGSAVVTEFPDRATVDAWFAKDPYVTQGVWKKIEVQPMKIAVRDGKIAP